MHALFKYYYLLNFNIVAVYDNKYTARVGANTSYLLKDDNALSLEIRNIDSIAWEEFDTIIIGHSDVMENMIGRPSYSEWLINEAYKHKKIFMHLMSFLIVKIQLISLYLKFR